MTETTYTVTVPEDKAGGRLDRALAGALPSLSRTRIKALIESGRVARHGCEPVADPARKVAAGDVFRIVVPPADPAEPRPESLPLDVVYEDDDLIVIDKPAGLVVHPAAGHAEGTLVNALLAHCRDSLSGIGGVMRPGIVHRLDKDTSGLLVVAKNDAAHNGLGRQFHEHSIERAYTALVWGVPRPAVGEIVGNIGRDPANRKRMTVVATGGKPARTHYEVIRALGGLLAARVRCRLETGRTHQIRVHMARIGHPVIGDPLYGGGGRRARHAPEAVKQVLAGLKGQALHAHLIGFRHPRSGEWLRFESKKYHYINCLEGMLNCN